MHIQSVIQHLWHFKSAPPFTAAEDLPPWPEPDLQCNKGESELEYEEEEELIRYVKPTLRLHFIFPACLCSLVKFPRQEENPEPELSALRRLRVRFHHMDTMKIKTFEVIGNNKTQGRQ